MGLQRLLRRQALGTAAPAQMAGTQLEACLAAQIRDLAAAEAALVQPAAVQAGQQAQTGTALIPDELRMLGGQMGIVEHHIAQGRAADRGPASG